MRVALFKDIKFQQITYMKFLVAEICYIRWRCIQIYKIDQVIMEVKTLL